MDNDKILRALLGACCTSILTAQAGQWTPERALGNIHAVVVLVAEELNIDLASFTQIERLREETVKYMEANRP